MVKFSCNLNITRLDILRRVVKALSRATWCTCLGLYNCKVHFPTVGQLLSDYKTENEDRLCSARNMLVVGN